MTRRRLKGFFVTDDRAAARTAATEGIPVVTTWDVLRLMVRGGRLTVAQFHAHVDTLVQANRGRPPYWPDPDAAERWLGVRR